MALGFQVMLVGGESVCKVRWFPGHFSKGGARIDSIMQPFICNLTID